MTKVLFMYVYKVKQLRTERFSALFYFIYKVKRELYDICTMLF